MSKKAMIFAAGLGTRLFPITSDRPKALAEVNGITLLEHSILYLSSYGFHKIIINTHHFADKIEEFLCTHQFPGVEISISFEELLLDTAGGLANAAHFFEDGDTILLFNVDVITNFNLDAMVAFHQKSGSDITLSVQNRKTSRYFLFDGNQRLMGWKNIATGESIISENASTDILNDLAFNGIHLINFNVLAFLGMPRKFSLTPFYLQMMNNLLISGVEINKTDYWFDCGKPETLELASAFVKRLN